MSSSDVSDVTAQLSKATVEDDGVINFVGRSMKLDTEEDAKEIVEAIENCSNLKTLKLEGNTLGVDSAKAISKALEKHPEFERAHWGDIFTGRLKSEIPQALRYLGNAMMLAEAQLVELNLSDNAFGPNGMEGLTELLKSKTCYTLKELRLNNNGLGVFGGRMLAKCLLECYKNSVAAGSPLALKVFVSGRGRLENEGSKALAEAFKAMGSLEELQMPQNGILHQGITALSDALTTNTQLRILNMNDNTFTEAGAQAMAAALPNLQKLEVLNFGDCLLRTKGAEAIADAIKDSHTSLKEIILSFNEIGRSGGSAIAEAMENKANLEKLELDGNQLGEEGVATVKATMDALEKLDMLGSLSEDEGSEDDDEEEEENDEGDDTKDEEIQGLDLRVKDVSLTPKQDAKPVSAAEFLQFPSPSKLQNLSGEKSKAILEHLGNDIDSVDRSMETFMKLASVVTQDDEKTRVVACACADAIFENLFSRDADSGGLSVTNSLLVHLGLLKGEEKRRPPSSIIGPVIVLAHVVRRPYFPKASKSTLEAFLSKPHPLLTTSTQSTHHLLQALYQT